jgi:hypothetical protein
MHHCSSVRRLIVSRHSEKHANVFIGNGSDDLSNSSDSQGESVGGQTYGTD